MKTQFPHTTYSNDANLASLVYKYARIYMDTCSLMNHNSESFFERIRPHLLAYQRKTGRAKRIIIPVIVCKELLRLRDDPMNKYSEETRQRAKAVIDFLPRLEKEGLIIFSNEDNNAKALLADNFFQSKMIRLRASMSVLLITQDHDLAGDIHLIAKQLKAVHFARPINVLRINSRAYLGRIDAKPTSLWRAKALRVRLGALTQRLRASVGSTITRGVRYLLAVQLRLLRFALRSASPCPAHSLS